MGVTQVTQKTDGARFDKKGHNPHSEMEAEESTPCALPWSLGHRDILASSHPFYTLPGIAVMLGQVTPHL